MNEPEWTWIHSVTIPSSLDSGHEVIEKLMAALTAAEWDGSDLFHVQMAAEEAMVNAVTHGNGCSDQKVVEMDFKVAKQSVFMRFKDQGEGFCPDDLPDPTDDEHVEAVHGRGVFLIRNMMDEVRYNECGNEVVMIKHRQTQAADSQS